jgi:hypothetical protein
MTSAGKSFGRLPLSQLCRPSPYASCARRRDPHGQRRAPASGHALFKGRRVNLSHVFAGQNVGVTQVGERIWLVTFMQYDLGYFDDETCRLEPIDNPFGPKVLPMCSE